MGVYQRRPGLSTADSVFDQPSCGLERTKGPLGGFVEHLGSPDVGEPGRGQAAMQVPHPGTGVAAPKGKPGRVHPVLLRGKGLRR